MFGLNNIVYCLVISSSESPSEPEPGHPIGCHPDILDSLSLVSLAIHQILAILISQGSLPAFPSSSSVRVLPSAISSKKQPTVTAHQIFQIWIAGISCPFPVAFSSVLPHGYCIVGIWYELLI